MAESTCNLTPNFIFPEGRHGREKLPHMMKFEIFKKTSSAEKVINADSAQKMTKGIAEGARNAFGVFGAPISLGANLLGSGIEAGNNNVWVNSVAGGIAGGIADIVNVSIEAGKPNKEPVANIYLPIPSNLQDNLQEDWGMKNESPLGIGIAALVTQDGDLAKEAAKRFVTEQIMGGGDIPSSNVLAKTFNLAKIPVAGGASGSSMAGRQLGFSYAPYRTLSYNAPKFKSFHFSWILSPSNADEAIALDTIIYMFKKYMSPSKSKTSSENFLLYPAECRISFLILKEGQKINQFLPIILDCVINSVSVSYDNKFHSDGSPSRIMLSVGVTESKIWTQEEYTKRYNKQESRPFVYKTI